jgi:hypothetical protein
MNCCCSHYQGAAVNDNGSGRYAANFLGATLERDNKTTKTRSQPVPFPPKKIAAEKYQWTATPASPDP